MTAGFRAITLLVTLGVCFAAAAAGVRQHHDPSARRTVVLRAVAEGVGLCSLALSYEGAATREPAEGPAGCLGDIPGGPCLRAVCDVVTSPGPVGEPFEVEHAGATR
jgi:hypothetical protein